jgi:hypothetical protein
MLVAFSAPAAAGTQSMCASLAAGVANGNISTVDVWLTRYHAAFDNCIAQHGGTITQLAPATKTELKIAVRPQAKAVRHHRPKRLKKIVARPAIAAPAVSTAHDEILSPAHLDGLDQGLGTWSIDCSQRYGSFSKDSEFYTAANGKRKPCSMR